MRNFVGPMFYGTAAQDSEKQRKPLSHIADRQILSDWLGPCPFKVINQLIERNKHNGPLPGKEMLELWLNGRV